MVAVGIDSCQSSDRGYIVKSLLEASALEYLKLRLFFLCLFELTLTTQSTFFQLCRNSFQGKASNK